MSHNQDAEKMKGNYFINSLARGMKVLSSFTPGRPMLTVSEMVEMTGLPQSTIFRLVYTLEYLGYLVRDETTRKYQQSVRMLSIGLAVRENLNIRNIATPFVKELSLRTGESAKLAILEGTEVLFVVVVEAPDKLIHRTPVGHRSPIHCTALGKILLAYQPEDKQEALLKEILFSPHTTQTITNKEIFKAVLDRARSLGYARNDEEYVPGMSSIAAPVFDDSGQVIAAVNLSGLLTAHLGEENISQMVQAVKDCARQISRALGYVELTERAIKTATIYAS